MTNKQALKKQSVKNVLALMRKEGVTLSDMSGVLAQNDLKGPKEISVFSMLSLYVACILLFSGAWLFLENYWTDFGAFLRVFLTYGVGEIFFIGAILWHRKEKGEAAESAFSFVLSPLFTLSFALKAIGFVVFAKEIYPDGDNIPLLAFCISTVLLFQSILLLRKVKLTIFAFLGLCLLSIFWWSSYALVLENALVPLTIFPHLKNDAGEFVGVETMFLYILVCSLAMNVILWCLQRSQYRKITGLGFFINTAAFYIFGMYIFSSLDLMPFFGVFLLVGFALFQVLQSKMVMLVTAIASFSYLSYLTTHYFSETRAWPFALMGLGLSGILIVFFVQKRMRATS